ncbi:MAG: 6-carboxytetrahydropterin synthase [Desulfobacter sp.]|nr:MAG: 6-carboxytetrahydropterin synthase [Desulfobacter sp.]
MLTITKELRFDAAHRLFLSHLSEKENFELFGKCSRFHGHTYRLRITVAGPVGPSGMIINFTALKAIVKEEILSRYDHADLNELEEYQDCPPTAENMSLFIFSRLQAALGAKGVALKKIRLYETPDSWAEVDDDT